tara:strand:+ start:4570 stop:5133 length:564 start_codon:yes stop_codon:yes gene_type:complete
MLFNDPDLCPDFMNPDITIMMGNWTKTKNIHRSTVYSFRIYGTTVRYGHTSAGWVADVKNPVLYPTKSSILGSCHNRLGSHYSAIIKNPPDNGYKLLLDAYADISPEKIRQLLEVQIWMCPDKLADTNKTTAWAQSWEKIFILEHSLIYGDIPLMNVAEKTKTIINENSRQGQATIKAANAGLDDYI